MLKRSVVALLVCVFWTSLSYAQEKASPEILVGGDTLILPEVEVFGTVSVEEALSARRSIRDFKDEDITLAEVAQLFWAAQGITMRGKWQGRTAPSAGALYPLQVYAIWKNRLWHYLPAEHGLELRAVNVTQEQLAEASLGQSAIKGAPLCFVLAGDYGVTAAKYGERATRYVHIEVGHAGQNILLQAVALGFGAVPMGAFQDEKVKELLKLPENEHPLYIIPVGQRAI